MRAQRHVARHRQEAVEALPLLDPVDARRHDVAVAPDGHAPPALLGGRVEPPVVERVAEQAVGDVVGSQPEAVDPKLDLTLSNRGGGRRGHDADAPQVVAPYLEVHAATLTAAAR